MTLGTRYRLEKAFIHPLQRSYFTYFLNNGEKKPTNHTTLFFDNSQKD